MIEARRKVETAQKAIERAEQALAKRYDELNEALRCLARVEVAYDRFCEAGELDRDLLTPECPFEKKILIGNDRAAGCNNLLGEAFFIEQKLLSCIDWNVENVSIDDAYEYITLVKTLDLSDVELALANRKWKTDQVKSTPKSLHVRFRRERSTTFDADTKIKEGVHFVINSWSDPSSLGLSIYEAARDRRYASGTPPLLLRLQTTSPILTLARSMLKRGRAPPN